MPTPDRSPVLADVADVLGDQLRRHLRRLAVLLHPHAHRIEQRFAQRLRILRFGPAERAALAAITPGAVARSLAEGSATSAFFEQVEYSGRRLAKLNLPPSKIVIALEEYDRLLTPLLRRLIPDEYENFRWVREQLHFCVILTLNNAYYQVREAETEAFYELFRVELESRNLDELLRRFIATLAQFSRADAAHLYLYERETGEWRRRASLREGDYKGGFLQPQNGHEYHARLVRALRTPRCWSWKRGDANGSTPMLLDPRWERRYVSCWSIPLVEGDRLAGVMQFGFQKTYEWLPREQELLAAAAERCLMAAEKARLVEDLAKQEEQVRTLAEHMLHVEEAERRRVSRELHDEAGQSLLCVRLQLEMIEQSMPAEAENLRIRLGEVRDLTERTILEIRRLIAALSPSVLEQLGLAAALRQAVTRFRRVHPAKVRLQISKIQNLPKKLEIIVYRLVQECCNNIAKHSQAKRVNISASTADGILRLLVEDDGVGFHVGEAVEKRNSFGLAGMRERVALMGGKFSIESWPHNPKPKSGRRSSTSSGDTKGRPREPRTPRGTRVLIELPIPKGAPKS